MTRVIKLTQDLQNAIDSSKDFSILFRELKPRRRLTEQPIVEIRNLANHLIITLNRTKPAIQLSLREAAFKGPTHERNFSLELEGLNETSNYKFLIMHFEDYSHENPESIKQRLWVFLDCVSQGYLTLNSNIFNGYRKDGGLIRAERDRKLTVECHPKGIHSILHEVECPSAQTQSQRIFLSRTVKEIPTQTYYTINGKSKESDYILKAFSELQFALKDLKRSLELQTRETKALRQTMESCDFCRARLVTGCATKPCYSGVSCLDLPNGSFRCSACPKGMTGDGIECQRLTTCNDRPCFQGAQCIDDEAQGFRCGPCPVGYKGNGLTCSPAIRCSDNPCYTGVNCVNYDKPPGYRCGACPQGLTGNGVTCTDIDECELSRPCNQHSQCINLTPGFRCGPCPIGYTGRQIQGIGVEFARANKQLCLDVNECDDGRNGGCVENSQCINTQGSYVCGECIEGFVGNQTAGCHPHPGTCPDGTICDGNAECVIRRGYSRYQCRCKVGFAGDGRICGLDSDLDGWPDHNLRCSDPRCIADNCPLIPNSGQEDADRDLIGDACDEDADNDGIINDPILMLMDPILWEMLVNQTAGCHPHPGTCPDGTICDGNAECVIRRGYSRYQCRCKVGFAGDGRICGLDSDLDGWPDHNLRCSDPRCIADNCPLIPNSGQEDADRDLIGDAYGDGLGDLCDPDADNDGVINSQDNCPLVANSDQLDRDGDGVGDKCDNCPLHANSNQKDSDKDLVGDVCDTNYDRDLDGIQDNVDNCPEIPNSDQLDSDEDGLGDVCDFDKDNDGIKDNLDNCPLVYNPDQRDTNNTGVGDACRGDFDGDGVPDNLDVCPDNRKVYATDFRAYQTVVLDPEGDSQIDPHWVIYNKGAEVVQTMNSDPGLAVGFHSFGGVDFEGTFFVDTEIDDDYVGFVFSYQDNAHFYTVMWKKNTQTYWQATPFRAVAEPGIQLKLVTSQTGPGQMLRNSLWHTGNTSDQVKLLWRDPRNVGWKERVAYRWLMIHRPKIVETTTLLNELTTKSEIRVETVEPKPETVTTEKITFETKPVIITTENIILESSPNVLTTIPPDSVTLKSETTVPSVEEVTKEVTKPEEPKEIIKPEEPKEVTNLVTTEKITESPQTEAIVRDVPSETTPQPISVTSEANKVEETTAKVEDVDKNEVKPSESSISSEPMVDVVTADPTIIKSDDLLKENSSEPINPESITTKSSLDEKVNEMTTTKEPSIETTVAIEVGGIEDVVTTTPKVVMNEELSPIVTTEAIKSDEMKTTIISEVSVSTEEVKIEEEPKREEVVTEMKGSSEMTTTVASVLSNEVSSEANVDSNVSEDTVISTTEETVKSSSETIITSEVVPIKAISTEATTSSPVISEEPKSETTTIADIKSDLNIVEINKTESPLDLNTETTNLQTDKESVVTKDLDIESITTTLSSSITE
ncbi:unnamed protein product [Oppiella nova]|uniref:Thrombospondin n=1 Tax=Oppiella nova TaxID=334625 RepID=A0A7R9QKN3_9ACAR|nr:unnamed protein product [Oppiella nova]CAG2167865.1 unnamed protein product [Oppiella nova]